MGIWDEYRKKMKPDVTLVKSVWRPELMMSPLLPGTRH